MRDCRDIAFFKCMITSEDNQGFMRYFNRLKHYHHIDAAQISFAAMTFFCVLLTFRIPECVLSASDKS